MTWSRVPEGGEPTGPWAVIGPPYSVNAWGALVPGPCFKRVVRENGGWGAWWAGTRCIRELEGRGGAVRSLRDSSNGATRGFSLNLYAR